MELFWKRDSFSARLEIPCFCEIDQVIFIIIPQQALIWDVSSHCTYLNSYSQMLSFIFSSEVRPCFPNFPFFSDFKTRVLNVFPVSSCFLHFAPILWLSDTKNFTWSVGFTKRLIHVVCVHISPVLVITPFFGNIFVSNFLSNTFRVRDKFHILVCIYV